MYQALVEKRRVRTEMTICIRGTWFVHVGRMRAFGCEP